MSQELKVLLGITVTTILLMVGAVWFLSKPPAPVAQADLIKTDSPQLGSTDSKVVLVEFLDPECEACRAAYPLVKQVLAENQGKVRFVVRYFPLHTNSVLAARATEAAGEQGKYWEMQEKLFQNQPTWGEQQTPQTELFATYAQELGLNVAQFRSVLSSSKYEDKVLRDKADGQAAGVEGTPTFFVNGVKVPNTSQLQNMIKQALAQ